MYVLHRIPSASCCVAASGGSSTSTSTLATDCFRERLLKRIQSISFLYMHILVIVVLLATAVHAASAQVAARNPRLNRRLANAKRSPVPHMTDAWALLKSPSEGTDITSDMVGLIRCHNQSSCIMPELQLQKVFKVYYCARTGHGVRFYYLVHEGLLLHPNIHLTPNIEEADVIVYLPTSSPWGKSECGNEKYYSRMLVLDEGLYNYIYVCVLCSTD